MKKIFSLFAAMVCAVSMFALTYNVTVPAGTKACYIAGEMNGWSQVEMTKVDDTHYTLDVADATDAMKYKYCSGPGWAYVEKTADGSEVADRTYAAEDVVEAWASVYDPGNVQEPGEAKDITVKAKVPAEWTDQITAWVWPTGGEGTEVVPTQEGEWYVVTHNCAELNIIFKNGAGWNGDANQTVDMTFTENTCIEITAGAGKANYTQVDCGNQPSDDPTDNPNVDPVVGITYNVTVPAGTYACYIAGQMTEWSHTEMTKVDDTHYTITIAEAVDTMKYKYCSGPGWAYVEKTATGEEVADRTYSANDVVEAWASVYDPNNAPEPGDAKDITVKAKVPAEWTDQITAWVWPTGGEGTEVVPTQEGDWYVVTHNCAELNIIFKNGAGWNGDANQTVDMTFSEDACIEITAGAGKATYTVVDCPETTDVEDVVTPKHATKKVINGQIVVIRDGVMFNLLGVEVK
ncbi:MAG: hypothetical protein J6R26_01090 [Paludibacteraceae bacterium]|nr:hypothetical protein [Paludibacteraceae bacterium]